MKRKKLFRNIPELPWSLKTIRGAIGKEYVIKHYSYGAIKTKYPDMSKIIASTLQRKQRNLFKEGVAFAKIVMSDPVQKEVWLKKVRKKHRLFNYLVAKGIALAKAEAAKRQENGEQIIGTCFIKGVATQKTEDSLGKRLTTNYPLPTSIPVFRLSFHPLHSPPQRNSISAMDSFFVHHIPFCR